MGKITHNFNFFTNGDGKIFISVESLLEAFKRSAEGAESEQECLAYVSYLEMFTRFKKNVEGGKTSDDDVPKKKKLGKKKEEEGPTEPTPENKIEKISDEEADTIIDNQLNKDSWWGKIIFNKK
jgi:hypothetical protein